MDPHAPRDLGFGRPLVQQPSRPHAAPLERLEITRYACRMSHASECSRYRRYLSLYYVILVKFLSVRAHEKGLELACRVDPDVPDALIGDVKRLRQIVVNLVANAIKFTDTGEVVLHASLETASETEAVLHVAVADTGIGIQPDKQPTVFEAFVQVDSSTTRRYSGTGLGLAIVSRLVALMGGRIWVESEVGAGSTFHFTARFKRAAAPLRALSAEELVGTRALVVDDNATNRRILEDTLRFWQMSPKVVSSVTEALAELREARGTGTPYPIVLSDVNMPDIDGFTLAEEIRREPELQSTVIMMLTSGGRAGDLARCETLDAGYLMKPVKQSELFDAIASGLGARTTVPADTAPVVPADATSVGSLRILLTEDSPANQQLGVGLLEKWGHTVTVANNGREAVDLSASQTFDLVLMDVEMPEMDGLQVTTLIRQREAVTGNHVPIIAMTAHAMKGDREKCLAVGMDGYLGKPLRATQLRQAIADVCAAVTDPTRPILANPVGDTQLNWAGALQAVQGDRQLLSRIVSTLLDECPALLRDLDRAIQAGNGTEVRRLAHTVKGSLRLFEPAAVIDLAGRLEAMGANGRLDGAIDVLASLRGAVDEITRELRQFPPSG